MFKSTQSFTVGVRFYLNLLFEEISYSSDMNHTLYQILNNVTP